MYLSDFFFFFTFLISFHWYNLVMFNYMWKALFPFFPQTHLHTVKVKFVHPWGFYKKRKVEGEVERQRKSSNCQAVWSVWILPRGSPILIVKSQEILESKKDNSKVMGKFQAKQHKRMIIFYKLWSSFIPKGFLRTSKVSQLCSFWLT